MILVLGPTGSGKSGLALHLAASRGGEIVNCDSVQLYRHLNIGTAKVSEKERLVAPHHLLDVLDPDGWCSAGDYARLARQCLADIRSRRQLPILAGGTGFYVRALIDGLFDGPPRDPDLRACLASREERRPGVSHRLLRRLDPPSAARIHPNDVQKTLRAVEVCVHSRAPMSGLLGRTEQPLEGFAPLKLGLSPSRTHLYERINRRVEQMFAGGLIDEVKSILVRGFLPSAKAFESIGYQQALAVIDGRMSVDEAVASTQQASRNYAKRQWTWFRRDPNVVWLEGFGDDAEIQRQTLCLVDEHLASHARTALPPASPIIQ